jgi:hypothetical protein
VESVVTAVMIDRLVKFAEGVSMEGGSNRLRDRGLGRAPADDAA